MISYLRIMIHPMIQDNPVESYKLYYKEACLVHYTPSPGTWVSRGVSPSVPGLGKYPLFKYFWAEIYPLFYTKRVFFQVENTPLFQKTSIFLYKYSRGIVCENHSKSFLRNIYIYIYICINGRSTLKQNIFSIIYK